MKKSTLMILALTAGAALLNAENTQSPAQPAAQKPQVSTSAVKATELTTDEQAFAAKLNDQNRKAFADKLNAEQRKSVMASVKNGGNADEAVAKLASSHVASAEKAAPAQPKTPAAK